MARTPCFAAILLAAAHPSLSLLPPQSFTRKSHRSFHTEHSSRHLSRTRLWWRSGLSRNPDADTALEEIIGSPEIAESSHKDGQCLALLFVGQSHAPSFERLAANFHSAMGGGSDGRVRTLALVGGGVIGDGAEVDGGGPAMSMLSGVLPQGASAAGFRFGGGGDVPSSSDPTWSQLAQPPDDDSNSAIPEHGERRPPSYILFVDPWSPIGPVVEGLDGSHPGAVVAGGISCPAIDAPTVALDGRALPRGSAAGICLTGRVGLQAVVAQGCRPVGPPFTVSSVGGGNVVSELSSKPAMERLSEVMRGATEGDRALIQSGGLLCGVAAAPADGSRDADDPEDYLVRQIIGLQPQAGAIVIGTDDVRDGDLLRFHVRDGSAAKEDMRLMIRRAKTERSFAGPSEAGRPLAAVQVSCVARGRSLFGTSDFDLGQVGELLQGGGSGESDAATGGWKEGGPPAIAGFFANGEIGPVGIAGFGTDCGTAGRTHMHGFTTVVAMLCDFGTANVKEAKTFQAESAWE